MSDTFIGEFEYRKFYGKIKFNDESLTEEQLIGICEYLDGKKYQDGVNVVENVLNDFLWFIIRKPSKDPYYLPAVESFLKSDYFSNKLKNDISLISQKVSGHTKLKKILESPTHLNDFDSATLQDIVKVFREYREKKKEDPNVNGLANQIFRRYMFVLDGEGPYQFVKSEYSDTELAKMFLSHAGLHQFAAHYNGVGVNLLELNEEHLIAIYESFERYLPDKKDEFVKLVRRNDSFAPGNFVNSYYKFVENGFSCKNLKFGELVADSGEYKINKTAEEEANETIRKGFLKHIERERKGNKELKKVTGE